MSGPDETTPPVPPRRIPTAAQQAASRAYGARSHGPTNPEGLARSRGNALKHGLTGQGVVLPPDLAAEVDARFAAYCPSLKPADPLQREVVRCATLAAVRLEHCVRHEAAALQERVRFALADWDRRTLEQVRSAAADLRTDPVAALAVLESSACGAAWLLEQ